MNQSDQQAFVRSFIREYINRIYRAFFGDDIYQRTVDAKLEMVVVMAK